MSNNLDDIYGAGGGSFLKARDFEQEERPFFWIRQATVVKKTFRQEEGEKQMIELSFFETPDNPLSKKIWSLNKTQALAIQNLYGSYENWAFKGVRIYKGQTKDRSGNIVATIAVYPDPYQMDEATMANARKVLQEAQFTGASQAPAVQSPPPQATTAPAGAPAPPPAPAFTPPSGFAPPSADSDPTSNW